MSKLIVRKYYKILIIALILCLFVFFVVYKIAKKSSPNKQNISKVGQSLVAETKLGNKYTFNAIDVASKKAEKIEFSLTSAELKEQIKFKESPVSAPDGRLFLLLRIEIKNDSPKRLVLASGDLIRISVENKLYAPDYHNGNVVIEPISVRPDQVVFVVQKNQKEFKFLVGEPAEEKQEITLKF